MMAKDFPGVPAFYLPVWSYHSWGAAQFRILLRRTKLLCIQKEKRGYVALMGLLISPIQNKLKDNFMK